MSKNCPSPSSCQLSIAPQLGEMTFFFHPVGMLVGLVLCREAQLLWVYVYSGPLITLKHYFASLLLALWLLQYFFPHSMRWPEPFWRECLVVTEHSTAVCSLHSDQFGDFVLTIAHSIKKLWWGLWAAVTYGFRDPTLEGVQSYNTT